MLQQQQKARQMEEEILYGSKPAGTKRFAGNTPTKTPSKVRKVADFKLWCPIRRQIISVDMGISISSMSYKYQTAGNAR